MSSRRALLALASTVTLAACAARAPHVAVAAAPSPADSVSAHRAATGFVAAFDSLQWDRFRGYLADDVTMFFPFAQVPRRADGRAAVEAVFQQFFEGQRAARTRAGRSAGAATAAARAGATVAGRRAGPEPQLDRMTG